MNRRVITVAAALAVVAGGLATPAGPAYAADRSPIPGSHPAWASPANRVAAADGAKEITFRVYLQLRDTAGAEAVAEAVSTPGSASYGQYLDDAQVLARYAPTRASVAAVSDWLRGAGLRVGEVAANNLYVEASGTVATTARAFGVGLGMYRVAGRTVRAGDRDLSIPGRLGSVVSGVVGVDGALNLLRPNTVGAGDEQRQRFVGAAAGGSTAAPATAAPSAVPPPDGFRNARPCSDSWAQRLDRTDPPYADGYPAPLPYAPCGYQPEQLRSAYGLSSLVDRGRDGRGVTVAIIDAFASPTLYQDAAEYARRHDPNHPLTRGQFSEIVYPATPDLEPPDQCDAAGWYGEQSLDVEAVHAMAPGAKILYVGASDCLDMSIDKALNDVVAHSRAQIVSNSYGNLGEDVPAAEVRIFNAIALQAALKGIGLYFSSGDSGDEVDNLGYPSPDFSASSPWVTAVGGTSVGVDRHGRTVLETGWETGYSGLSGGVWTPAAPGAFFYGSGGGTSRLFAQPFYQRGVVPDALARQNQTGSAKGRVVPDVSMVGDPNTGMLVGQTQTFPDGVYYDEYRIGGTSLSAPLLAGYLAVADQVAGHRHGFINPALYRAATRSGAVRDVLHVTGGVVRVDYVNGVDDADGLRTSVRTFDHPGLAISTTPGYDTVTGLGVPDGAKLLFAL